MLAAEVRVSTSIADTRTTFHNLITFQQTKKNVIFRVF